MAVLRLCSKSTNVSPGQSLDRKSTRLNSSHGYISYAVFCLKKKNTLLQEGRGHTLDDLGDVLRVHSDDRHPVGACAVFHLASSSRLEVRQCPAALFLAFDV